MFLGQLPPGSLQNSLQDETSFFLVDKKPLGFKPHECFSNLFWVPARHPLHRGPHRGPHVRDISYGFDSVHFRGELLKHTRFCYLLTLPGSGRSHKMHSYFGLSDGGFLEHTIRVTANGVCVLSVSSHNGRELSTKREGCVKGTGTRNYPATQTSE